MRMSLKLGAIFFVVSLFMLGVPTASAVMFPAAACSSTCYVATTGNDGNDGDTPATAKLTIQAAVNQVGAGGQVIVAAGTYNEAVTVNKAVTLSGAQAGVDARGRVATESIVQGTGGSTAFSVTADDVTIDGFTVRNATSWWTVGAGVYLAPSTSHATFVNNIVTNNIAGLFLANDNTVGQTLIRHNVFSNNNQPGPAVGQGIYMDQYTSGGTVSNVLIDANAFIGNNDSGIGFSSTDPTKPATNITISGNTFDGNGRGLYAFNLTDSTITGNTFQNSTASATADLRIFEGSHGLTIDHNVLQNGAGRAYRANNVGTGSPDPTDIHLNRNSITGYAGPAGIVQNDATPQLDAECNWWGSATGPTNPNNPLGTGSSVVGDVDFIQWLVFSDLDGPCIGQPGGPPGGGGGSLTVLRVGNGTGTITSNPPGINCPPDCGEQVTSASAVSVHPAGDGVFVLTAHPSSGSVFTGWSGGGCSGTGTCTVVVSGDVLVSAWFSTATAPGTGADVSASVTAPETGQVGTASTFSLGVANDGPQVATGVSVTGELPASSLIGTPSASQGTCQVLGTSFTCQIGSLAAGGSATIGFPVTPYRGGPAALSAQVSATQTDPDSTNNGATASTEVAVVCTITGTGHSDTLHGTSGIDVICGKAGPDTLKGMEGNDIVMGGAGDDVLRAGKGDDLVRGGPDDDSLKGGPDTDVCEGGVGENTFIACES